MRRATMTRIGLSATLLLATVACQKVWGFEDFEEGPAAGGGGTGAVGGSGGTAGTSAGGAGGTAGSAGAAPCEAPDGGLPGMVGLHKADGSCVFIDQLEVSTQQYLEFLSSNPTGQVSGCEWNEDLATPQAVASAASKCTPTTADAGAADGGADDAGSDGGLTPGELAKPATCVDWCDAAEYCRAQDKTLCPGLWGSPKDPKTSAWYLACGGPAGANYPYGSSYQSGVCNDSSTAAEATTDRQSCVSADGVQNLLGNVAEWVDECEANPDPEKSCKIRGGAFNDANATCDLDQSSKMKLGYDRVGFRCCWEPPK